MLPTIRIDEEVFEELKRRAEPFVDTPNTVLRRVLELNSEPEAQDDTQARRTVERVGGRRMAPGILLPHEAYVRPILSAIDERGGAAPSQEVVRRVGEVLNDDFQEADFSRNKSGGVRWMNRVAWVRLKLVNRGLLAKNSPRGIWALTDAGRETLRRAKAGTLDGPILGPTGP